MLTDIEPIQRLDPPQRPVPEKRLGASSVEAVNGAGAPFEGEQLILFISATTDDRIVVQYAHDPATDTAVGATGDVVATSGVTVSETVRCLQQRTGAATRLDAVIAAVEEQQANPGRQSNDLYQCEEGATRE